MTEFFGTFGRLVKEWLARARDGEVEAILSVVRDELRRRGHERPCEEKRPEEGQEG